MSLASRGKLTRHALLVGSKLEVKFQRFTGNIQAEEIQLQTLRAQTVTAPVITANKRLVIKDADTTFVLEVREAQLYIVKNGVDVASFDS